MAELRLRENAVAWKEVDGQVLLLDVASSSYMTLNSSAAVLWPLLAHGATRVDLVSRLVDEFGLDSVQASADLDAFLAELDDRGLLED